MYPIWLASFDVMTDICTNIRSYFSFAAGRRSAFRLFQFVAVPVHVLDGLNHTFRALSHLADRVSGVDQIPVTFTDHLSKFFLFLLDLPPHFSLDSTNLIGAISFKQNGGIFDF